MRKKRQKRMAPVRPDVIIRIVFNPQKGTWIAAPGLAILSPGNAVEWKALRCNKYDFIPDPAAFENVVQGPGTKVTATVRMGVSGYYICAMKADNNPVQGGSSPAVIID